MRSMSRQRLFLDCLEAAGASSFPHVAIYLSGVGPPSPPELGRSEEEEESDQFARKDQGRSQRCSKSIVFISEARGGRPCGVVLPLTMHSRTPNERRQKTRRAPCGDNLTSLFLFSLLPCSYNCRIFFITVFVEARRPGGERECPVGTFGHACLVWAIDGRVCLAQLGRLGGRLGGRPTAKFALLFCAVRKVTMNWNLFLCPVSS